MMVGNRDRDQHHLSTCPKICVRGCLLSLETARQEEAYKGKPGAANHYVHNHGVARWKAIWDAAGGSEAAT